MSQATARQEIRKLIGEIVQARQVPLSTEEEEYIVEDICDDMLGFGPLEPLLARDDISDIMIYGPSKCFIEVNGEILATDVRFRDHDQLLSLCQRMVSRSGRRVDESSPICDARLPDGSRVNVIVPPLAVHGVALTIRKFRKTRLTLDELTRLGMISSRRRGTPEDHRPCAMQRHRFRGNQFRQDDAAELSGALYRTTGENRHLRGHGRTAAPAAARHQP